MTKYQNATNTRREARSLAGRFRGGKLAPVMATAFRESESAMLSQQIVAELDPIPGRMKTPITLELVSVYVPIPALDAAKNSEEDYAGNIEVVRDKLLSGTPLFGLEEENEISKRLGINPRSVAGTKMVNEAGRMAYITAYNYLARRKYVKAWQSPITATYVQNALIGSTVLDRLNGVLDPEDRVNGAVELEFGNIALPVKGLGAGTQNYTSSTKYQTGGDHKEGAMWSNDGPGNLYVQEDPNNPGYPGVFVHMSGANAGNVSLTDFYNAELQDLLARQMRQIVDENPEYGEEMASRWAHGMSVDTGKHPFVLHHSEKTFGQNVRHATDGLNLDTSQSDLVQTIDFTVPVPRTELGGIVITMAAVKPDETLASQPHPFLSDVWGAQNFVSDELARDPVPVSIRELYSDCLLADEDTRALYVGHNGLKKAYVSYGFNRHIDVETVEAKVAIWQLEVPMSVTPESVFYPTDLSHYPFADQNAEVCTYQINSNATVRTPMIFGPTPVEELAEIESEDIFDDE